MLDCFVIRSFPLVSVVALRFVGGWLCNSVPSVTFAVVDVLDAELHIAVALVVSATAVLHNVVALEIATTAISTSVSAAGALRC